MHTPDFARQKAEELGGSMMSIAGKWRITEMDLWDQDAIDLLGPAFIEFGNGRSGQFRFIAVDGWMDCVHKERNGWPYVEFTWDGNDECDPASGRGWAKLQKDGSLSGRIYIHHCDNSGFKAISFKDDRPAAEAAAKRKSR
jgi:hypothetical protein